MEQRSLGSLQAHAAAILLGGTALFAQLIELPAVLIICIRALIAGVVLCALLLLMRQRQCFSHWKDYAVQGILGLLLGIHWATYYHSIQLSTVTIGIATLSAYPLYTVFLEVVCGHQSLRMSKILVTGIIIIGVFLLIPEFDVGNQTTEAILLGILSGMAYALRNVFTKPYLRKYGGLSIMMHQAFVASFFCLVVSYVLLDMHTIHIDSYNWTLLIVCGIIFTAGPHALLVCAFRHLSASTASNIVLTQVLYATVLSLLILGSEFPTFFTIIGALCIVAGGIIESCTHKE